MKTRLSEMERKYTQLQRQYQEMSHHSEINSREIGRLREDNKFLAAINAEFGYENDEFKRKNGELEMENVELKEKLDRFHTYRLPGSLT